MIKKNIMGSEVVAGYRCKPKVLDENKPIMFSAIHLFVCEGKRCKEGVSDNLAARLRLLIKELGFDTGSQRIKVTRTFCNGACRFKQFAYTYKNVNSPNFIPENAFTAWKKVHTWSDDQWRELFLSLVENKDAPAISKYRVANQISDTPSHL